MTAYTFMWKRSSYFSFSFEPCWSVKMYEVALTNYTMTMISWKVPRGLIKLILPLIDACGASSGRETVTCKFWGLVLQLRTKLSDAVALLFQYLRQAISPRKGSRRIYANSEPDSRQVFSTEGSLWIFLDSSCYLIFKRSCLTRTRSPESLTSRYRYLKLENTSNLP